MVVGVQRQSPLQRVLIGVLAGVLCPVLDISFRVCEQLGKKSDKFNRLRKCDV